MSDQRRKALLGAIAFIASATLAACDANSSSPQNSASDSQNSSPKEEASNSDKYTPVELETFVELKIKPRFRDPDSVRFSDVVAYIDGGKLSAFCGLINAKNGFGGYAGPQFFVYSDSGLTVGDEALSARASCHGTREVALNLR